MEVRILIGLALALLGYAIYRRWERSELRARFKGRPTVLAAVVLVVLSMLVLLNPELLSLGFLGDAAFADLFVFLIGVRFRAVGTQMRAWIETAFSAIFSCFKTPRMVYTGVLFCIAFENVVAEIRDIVHRISS
jgi:hypothetical protein